MEEETELDMGYYSAWISLILAPITMAIGALQIRKMRAMNEFTPNFYATLFGVVMFGIFAAIEEEGY